MDSWGFDAIGTRWEIATDDPLDAAHRERVTSAIDAFDRAWSRFRADSLVVSLAQGGSAPAPADAAAMLDLYVDLSAATGGAVDPLVGDSLSALGYDAEYSLVAGRPIASPGWEGTLSWTGGMLALTRPATIDVGALGKGRLVDLVLAELADVAGDAVVDASGDLRVRGSSTRIALEHPFDRTRAIGVATIADRALCASATNRRAWGDGLHHVIDARTGLPITRWAATWAIADDAMTADAAATALFFDGGVEFAARHGAAWVRMSTDGRAQRSPGAPVELFTSSGSPR